MAATYRSSTSTTTASTPAGSIVLTLPAGVQVGDTLLAYVSVDGGTGATVNTPAGWTSLRNTTQSTNVRTVLYWRVANGQETSTYSFSFDINRQAAGCMVAYSGANIYSPAAQATANTSTAATTLVAATVNTTYESGMVVKFAGTRNTTAASTITPGAGFQEREDVCTTASAFIGAQVQEIAKGLRLGGSTNVTSTCSQTVNAIETVVFVEDTRPAFVAPAEDQFSEGSITASAGVGTIINMQTNYPNEVLLALVTINKDVTTISSISGASLTWVFVARANTNAGSTELWRAFAPVPLAPFAITVNFTAPVVSANMFCASIAGADFTGTNGSGAIGAVATGTSTTAAPTINLTTTRNNSWVWAAANESGVNGSMTAGANQTVLRDQNDTTNVAEGWIWRQNAVTPASGTVVTMNSTVPSTASCNILAVEILPAVIRSLDALGVG